MAEYRELLLGCGSRRDKLIRPNDVAEWKGLVTLDNNPAHNPDVRWDLEKFPWPFDNDTFDSCHAYETIEHCTGYQGDAEPFFAFFSEAWRILKPNGLFCATTPAWNSKWAWGDPSHKRIINEGTLTFLSQRAYAEVGKTPMSDFRYCYTADFEPELVRTQGESLIFVLRAVKSA